MRGRMDILDHVMIAVRVLKEPRGVTTEQIVNVVKTRLEGVLSSRRNVNVDVRRALDLAVSKGLLDKKCGHYTVHSTAQTVPQAGKGPMEEGKCKRKVRKQKRNLSALQKRRRREISSNKEGTPRKKSNMEGTPRKKVSDSSSIKIVKRRKNRKRQATPMVPQILAEPKETTFKSTFTNMMILNSFPDPVCPAFSEPIKIILPEIQKPCHINFL